MEAKNRHYDAWELIHDGKIILAKELLKQLNADEVFRQIVRKRSNEQSDYLLCRHCKTKIHHREPSAVCPYVTLSHNSKGKSIEKHEAHVDCPFCITGDSTILSQFYNGEGVWHQTTKLNIVSVLNRDPFCLPDTAYPEKYYFGKTPNSRRRPDVQFTDMNGQLWALELTNHWMNPEIAVQREQFFMENNFNLIWIMSPFAADSCNAMYRFTMFGLAGDAKNSNRVYGHFNAFVMTEEAMAISAKTGELHLLVEFPVFSSNSGANCIDWQLESKIVKLSELLKISGNPIPYFQDQGENYLNAKNELEETIRAEQRKEQRIIDSLLNELPSAVESVEIAIENITIENPNSNYDDNPQLDENIKYLQSIFNRAEDLLVDRKQILPQEILNAKEYIDSLDLRIIRKVRSLRLGNLALINEKLPELTERLNYVVKVYAGEESDCELDDAKSKLEEALTSAKRYAKLVGQFDSRNMELAEESLDLVDPNIIKKRNIIKNEKKREEELTKVTEDRKRIEQSQKRFSKLSGDIENFIQKIKDVSHIGTVQNYHVEFDRIESEANYFTKIESKQLMMSLRVHDKNIVFRSYLRKYQQLKSRMDYSFDYEPLLGEVLSIIRRKAVLKGVTDRHMKIVIDILNDDLQNFENRVVNELELANESQLPIDNFQKLTQINKFLYDNGRLQNWYDVSN